MFTRAELKSRARENLSFYYFKAFLVSFLTMLLTGGLVNSGGTASVNSQLQAEQMQSELEEKMSQVDPNVLLAAMGILTLVILVAAAASLLWSVFLGNPVAVGSCRFYMESRGRKESAGVGKLFWSFERGRYWNTVKVMFLRSLSIFLWSLVFIIPGIIKAYQYYMVPYILSENPSMNYRNALALSKKMMEGQKLATFVLELSFIGWLFLGTLLCGVGVLLVFPYMEATRAELYAVLRMESGQSGRSLPGFGDGPQEPYADYTIIE